MPIHFPAMSRVSGKPYFVYILWSESAHLFYIGISEDVQKRLSQHNAGASAWSARHRPWALVCAQSFTDYSSAKLRETQLKKQKGGAGFFKLTGLDPLAFPRERSTAGS